MDADLLENVSQFAEQDLLDAYFNHSYNIILNLQLVPTTIGSYAACELPLDSIKVVHFWHLFSPFHISTEIQWEHV